MKTSFPFSLSSFLLVSVSLIALSVFWYPSNVIAWDVFGYYLYLPMTFIYGDLRLHDHQVVLDIIETYRSSSTFYQAFELPNGNWVMKYSAGMAILYLPAFLFGHLLALVTEYPADGFSFPYQLGMFIEMVLVAIASMWFLRKVLLKFFSDKITALVLASVFFGTNYLINVTLVAAGTQTHNYLFLAYAIILWFTIRWEEERQVKHIILLGLTCGLAILSRPSEIVCLLIPLFWGVVSWSTLKNRLVLLFKEWKQLIVFSVVVACVGAIQLVYWKYITGHFLHYSYVDATEGGEAGIAFNFWKPHLTEVLFSFRKGWFVYTPAMFLAFLGLIIGIRKKQPWSISLSLFFIFNLWIVSSWHCWWYAECFGQRSLVQCYPIMAVGLGALLTLPKSNLIRGFVWLAVISTIGLNLHQSYQYERGVIDPSRQTKEYYMASFFDAEPHADRDSLKLVQRDGWEAATLGNENDYFVVEVANLTFEDGLDVKHMRADSVLAKNGKFSGFLDGDFSVNHTTRFDYLTSGHYVWIRLSAYVYPLKPVKEHPITLVAETNHGAFSYKYQSLSSDGLDLKEGQWNYIKMDYLSPEMRFREDQFKAYLWNQGQNELYIDDLKLEVFIPKFDPER